MLENFIGGDFFVYVFPWMLTLAIVYGILEHYKIPKSPSARAVISLVAAFLVLPVGPSIAPFLTNIIKSLIVVAVGILVALIFVEMLGFKVGEGENIFEKYPVGFGIILIIIAILVFISSGGMDLLNIEISVDSNILAAFFFLGVMALGVWWITVKEEE